MKKLLTLTALIQIAITAGYSQPANDNCGAAISLTAGTICTTGNTTAATVEPFESAAPANQQCWLTAPNNTVWYTFTPAATGMYTVTTDNRLPDATFPDMQLKILSGTCGAFTMVACSEDDGIASALAAQVTSTLNAGNTYYIQVDVYGTATATFCISVFRNSIPVNDCINNAIDLTSFINGVSTTNPYDCNYGYIYNAPGGGLADDPIRQDVINDSNGCNGYDPILPMTENPDHRDVWFKFTKSGITPQAYMQLFPANDYPVLWVMGLYAGVPSSTCPNGNISGLTYIDCSCGVLIDIPPGNEHGDIRDKSLCSTPIHPRLDISNLANGTYYIRVWDFGGLEPPEGIFNLCVESIAPRTFSSDTCSAANIGYTGPLFNQDVNTTYSNLSNAGAHGNSCNTATNEPLLGATPAGQARTGCTGPWVTYVGAINNVMNITMIHSFVINACPTCEPTALIQLDNIVMDGTIGNVAQLQVMAPNNCINSTQTIMNGVTGSDCIEMRVAANAPLPNGQYYIVVDGQDGQLLMYDLTLTINYPCLPSSSCTPLPIELISFKGENINGKNRLEWITASETGNDYFEIERSNDGIGYEIIKKVDGAGNSNTTSYYSIVDEHTPFGISYYRLRQVDFNGEASISPVVALTNKSLNSDHNIILMKDDDQLIVKFNSDIDQAMTLRIMDVTGKINYRDEIATKEGMNEVHINTSQLQSGLYFLEISDTRGLASYSRFSE